MGLKPFKIKAGCGIYLWTKKKGRSNEQHRFFVCGFFFFFPFAAQVVSSGGDDLFEMHVFRGQERAVCCLI